MRFLSIAFALCLVSTGLGAETKEPAVGSYVTEQINGSYYHHLKFYEDCAVIGVSSTGTSQRIGSWFNRDYENLSRGRYTASAGKITFTLTSFSVNDEIRVDYEGSFHTDTLTLASHSHFNGNRVERTYQFVPASGYSEAIRLDEKSSCVEALG